MSEAGASGSGSKHAGMIRVAQIATFALLLGLGGCFLFRNGEGDRCQAGRTVLIGSQDDVASFAGCKEASGITIRTGATVDLAPLRELEHITGDLVIGPTVGIEDVAFNGLQHVGGAVRVSANPSLHGLFLPRLEDGGRIAIEGNLTLTTIALPRVATVYGSIVISDNRALELVSVPELVTVGHELVILDHPKLALVEVGRLNVAEAVRIEGNPKLPVGLTAQIRAKGTNP